MRKWIIVSGIILMILVIGTILLFLRGLNGGEDNYIKDSKGIYIKHGKPSIIPSYVKEQQDAISCGKELYNNFMKTIEIGPISQCLGRCNDYSIDLVHNPRTTEDDKTENQCSDFRNKITHKFIELDKNGEIVRINS